ncbi:hypothetical protein [Acinetobacter sp. ANC 5045]|uniref:hypothetical protein n=1 Tax=Acinetobacter sp. ANC 5045 TaxID=2529851 RepID=UPI00103C629A|nr:hypothetical protein [Acinetobacter sp. ANC 5045]TCB16093.1 hypothetical protein E0H79_10180 [Acinetobacter sp. ANC 5045]
MKANEFFKAVGLRSVKQFLENGIIRTIEMHESLKRLVESHELVEKLGGVEMAEYEYMVSDSYSDPYWIRVKQAITDVESCQ